MPHPLPERRLRILLCGYGHLGLGLLQGLLASPYCEVAGVFRWSSRPESRDCWEPVEGQFQQLVEQSGLSDIRCSGINAYEFSRILGELKPDVVLIGSWGEIIKPHLIDQPDFMLINCHPSLLPAHRGANPYASAILAGDAETGVTFHRVAVRIDAGAILMQDRIPLDSHDTGGAVREKCALLAQQMTPLLIETLHRHLRGGEPLEETVQDESQKSHYPPLKPSDGLLDWQKSPWELYVQWRGLLPWIACYSHLEGKRPVFLYDLQFIPRPAELPENGELPGTILSVKDRLLRISLSDPAYIVQVSSYQMAGIKGYLSIGLSRFLAPWFLRPGKRFFSNISPVPSSP